MDSREEIAREVEETLRPLLDKPGYMNALGTFMLALKVIREGKK